MSAKIKIDLNHQLSTEEVAIEIGCGTKRKHQHAITIDRVDLDHVDIVADIETGLPFFPDQSVDIIYCRSVLEHVENFEGLLRDMLRILKPDGKACIFVPHFSNPYFYSDYTHKRFFGLYSFYYFVEPGQQLKRKVPVFYTDIRLEIVSLRLTFRTSFWVSRHLRKVFGFVVNLSSSLQEFYELHLSHIIPCNGIELVFTRPRGDNRQI